MDNHNLFNRIIGILEGNNGPVYVGIGGIVIIVAARYGYKFIKKSGDDEIQISAGIAQPELEEKLRDSVTEHAENEQEVL